MTTGISEQPHDGPIVPHPFLLLFVTAATPTANNDPTIWETESESGQDGVVRKDYADDEDEGQGTDILDDSDSKEDEDAKT
jgi:hypothetical protein